jgi:preprotein translocase subunit SecG
MQNILKIAEVVVSVLLIIIVLLQERGSGLGSMFGGEGGFYRSRRGVEKILFNATIVLGVLFAGIGVALIIL